MEGKAVVTRVTMGRDCYEDLVYSVNQELVSGTQNSDPIWQLYKTWAVRAETRV